MKKFFYLFASLAVLASCASKGEGEPVVEPTLTVTPVSLTAAPEGDEVTFKVTTNKSWTVTSNQDWAQVSPASGETAEGVTVTVTVGANETDAERTATLTVKAETLTKTVNLSQECVVAPAPGPDPDPTPTPGENTQYQRSTDPLVFADNLQDGKYYVLYSKYFTTELWTEASGKLTMTENETTVYGVTNVFQYKSDNSKLNTTFDSYGNFAAGAWKSMSTGKYLDADFNLTAELENAVYLEYANNWGSTNASNEINVMDVYKCPVEAGQTLSLWYHENQLVYADNGYAYANGAGTNKRKWVIYEVTVVNQ